MERDQLISCLRSHGHDLQLVHATLHTERSFAEVVEQAYLCFPVARSDIEEMGDEPRAPRRQRAPRISRNSNGTSTLSLVEMLSHGLVEEGAAVLSMAYNKTLFLADLLPCSII